MTRPLARTNKPLGEDVDRDQGTSPYLARPDSAEVVRRWKRGAFSCLS